MPEVALNVRSAGCNLSVSLWRHNSASHVLLKTVHQNSIGKQCERACQAGIALQICVQYRNFADAAGGSIRELY